MSRARNDSASVALRALKVWPVNFYFSVFGKKLKTVPDDAEEAIVCVLDTIGQREKSLVLARFRDYRSFTSIGKEFGLSSGRVSQIVSDVVCTTRRPSKTGYLTNLTMQRARLETARETLSEAVRQKKSTPRTPGIRAAMKSIYIDELGISSRSYHYLSDEGIITLADLAGKSIPYLKNLKNLGPGSVNEIVSACAEYGVVLEE